MEISKLFEEVSPEAAGVDSTKLAAAGAYLDAQFDAGEFPGAALLASRNGKLFLERYWGAWCSSYRRDNPMKGNIRHILYSFSKVVSATVVMRLIDQGLLELDAPLSRYIPCFKGGGRDKATLRHALTHSVGVPNVPFGPVDTEELWHQGVELVCSVPLEWEPGTRTFYHALSGLFLAAECARAVTNRTPWPELARKLLFEPLGGTFGFETPGPTDRVALSPQPAELPTPLDGAHYGLLGHPAGGVMGTPRDMLRLLNLHLNHCEWPGGRLLSEAAFEEMHRVQYLEQIQAALAKGQPPTHEYWALGWLTRGPGANPWFGLPTAMSEAAYGHAGINTVIGVADPETNLAIAFITTNSPKSDEKTNELRNTVTTLVANALL